MKIFRLLTALLLIGAVVEMKAYGLNWIPSMVVVGPDGKVVLSTVLTYKVDKYLKELTTGAYKPQISFHSSLSKN